MRSVDDACFEEGQFAVEFEAVDMEGVFRRADPAQRLLRKQALIGEVVDRQNGRDLGGDAPVIHAASGYDMAHLAYQPGRSRPDCCGIYLADVVTGIYAIGAISAALYQRHGSQKGQHIDVSMLESMLSLTLNELQWSQFEVRQTQRPMFGPVETADGYVMLAIASEKTFQSLIKVIGHPEWTADPRFAIYADRRENWAALMNGVESWSHTL